MLTLLAGLVLFLAPHSIRIFAEGWRDRTIERMGKGPWKGVYSLVSIAGLVLIVWGYAMTRAEPVTLWNPPAWTRHIAALVTLPAFILLAAAYVPGNRIKARIGHPMIAGVKLWAFAHLISNGRLGDVLLFGAFILWAVFDFRAARARDRAAAVRYPPGSTARDVAVVIVGLAAWGLFAIYLHAWLIGVRPFA